MLSEDQSYFGFFFLPGFPTGGWEVPSSPPGEGSSELCEPKEAEGERSC